MKKRSFTLFLTISLLFSLSLPAFAAPSFSDLSEKDWYCTAVREMAAAGYVEGYPDGRFGGEDAMSVAEFITLFANFFGMDRGEQDGHWAGVQMASALRLGWLDQEDIRLSGGPDQPVQRQLAAKILLEALDMAPPADASTGTPFSDAQQIQRRYLPYVAEAFRSNLFVGEPDGAFHPEEAIQRGGGATLVYRTLHREDPLSKYSRQEIIDYFVEVALHSEYSATGTPGSSNPVHKWTAPVYYSLSGAYTAEDLAQLEALAAQLNQVPGFPGIYPADADGKNANLRIEFLSGQEMDYYPGHYMPRLEGYATITWYSSTGQIFKGGIAYRTELDQFTRNSVICEELIQSLGMLNDSHLYSDSIFYQYGSEVQWPSALDWKIVELLYDPAICPGMNEAQCRSVLSRLIP